MAVVAVLSDATLRARLAGALRGRGVELRFCTGGDEVRATLARGAARALVVGTCDADGRSTAPLVEQVRRDFPQVTVVAYCALARGDPGTSAALVALVRAGVHAALMRDVDDEPHALRTALRMAEQSCAAQLVLEAIGDELPPGVRPLVALYLRSDDRPLEVAEAARALGVHRRTLVNRMRAAGCPPPRALRTWCRVFVAARLLEEPGRTVESVATQLRFDSPAGLRNSLRRYTGCAPGALRSAGGLRRALGAFTAACAARRLAHTTIPQRRPRRVVATGSASTDDAPEAAAPAAVATAAVAVTARPPGGATNARPDSRVDAEAMPATVGDTGRAAA